MTVNRTRALPSGALAIALMAAATWWLNHIASNAERDAATAARDAANAKRDAAQRSGQPFAAQPAPLPGAAEDSPDLKPLRKASNEIFAAQSDAARRAASEKTLSAAEKLLRQPGVIGTTAALYHIGAAPLAGLGRQVDIPAADRVRQVPTPDLLNVARLFFSTRRFEPADQLITLVLDRQDEHLEAALRLAITIRFDIGRDQDVLQHCEQLIEMKPNSPEFYRVQMMVHRNHGRWDNFIPAAEKAVQLTQGTDWVLLIELADGYTHLGRTEEARAVVAQIQQHRPDLLERAPVMHARLLVQEGRNAEATEIIDNLLRDLPEDSEALLMKGKMLVAEENFAAAVEIFETLLATAPAEEQAYYQLGQAHARLGDAELAREYLQKHRQLLDAKVRLYKLEQQAAAEPFNQEVRRELVDSYKEIGLTELSDFWARSADQVGAGARAP